VIINRVAAYEEFFRSVIILLLGCLTKKIPMKRETLLTGV